MTLLEMDLKEGRQTDTFVGALPFASSRDHLWASLAVVEMLIRAYLVRWQLTNVQNQSSDRWGAMYLSHEEAAQILELPFMPPDVLPASLLEQLRPYWEEAEKLAALVSIRLSHHDNVWGLRLARLSTLYQLSEDAQYLLWLCLLPELDERYGRLIGYFHDDLTRQQLTTGLAQQILFPLLQNGPETIIDCSQTLQQLGFFVDTPQMASLGQPMLQLAPRLVAFLQGSDALDAQLTQAAVWVNVSLDWQHLRIPPDKKRQMQAVAQQWAVAQPRGMILFFYGPQGSGRLKAARAVCAAWNRPLLAINVKKGLQSGEPWPAFVARCMREARLYGAAIAWLGCDVLRQRELEEAWQVLLTAVTQFETPTFLLDRHYWHPNGQTKRTPFFRIEFSTLTFAARLQLWRELLPVSGKETHPFADALANGFQFTEGQIEAAFMTAQELALQEGAALNLTHFFTACRRESEQHLIQMAQRIEPRTHLTFDDLIVPSTCKRQLNELRQRMLLRHRLNSELGFEKRLTLGKGLVALFTGGSGTGKTMAAELLAREQGVDLYKVDLSAVVSKYVGETEKNLNRVFAEAEDANAIILFDEADSLFGKRSEVKDARDRWANMEVNYLLQRVEEYEGSVILTTNFQQNIDDAFLRRIQMVVPFPFPTADERYLIWKGLFPVGVKSPPDEALALLSEQFELSGGSLKNIVVDAAYRALAAAKDGKTPKITVRHLVAAIAREHQKQGKPITRGQFGEQYYRWIEVDIL